jgi:hypothetical protein
VMTAETRASRVRFIRPRLRSQTASRSGPRRTRWAAIFRT